MAGGRLLRTTCGAAAAAAAGVRCAWVVDDCAHEVMLGTRWLLALPSSLGASSRSSVHADMHSGCKHGNCTSCVDPNINTPSSDRQIGNNFASRRCASTSFGVPLSLN